MAMPRSWIAADAERRCLLGIHGAPHIGVDLRRINAPDFAQLVDRLLLAPIDAQINDRPADLADNEQARRTNRPSLTAPRHPSTQSIKQPLPQVALGLIERRHHRGGYIGVGEKISRRRTI